MAEASFGFGFAILIMAGIFKDNGQNASALACLVAAFGLVVIGAVICGDRR